MKIGYEIFLDKAEKTTDGWSVVIIEKAIFDIEHKIRPYKYLKSLCNFLMKEYPMIKEEDINYLRNLNKK